MAQTQSNLDSEINTQLASGIDITAATLRQVLRDMNAAVFQSGVTGFASPSAQIGLASQAGSSTSAMRADAAPALNVGIAPIWTGQHIFAAGVSTTSAITGTVIINSPGGLGVGGNGYFGGFLNIGSLGTAGQLQMNGSAAGTATLTISALGNTATLSGTMSLYGNIVASPVEAGQKVTGTCSGTVATTDISMIIPPGVTLLGIQAYTTGSFGASGSVNLTAGTAIGDNAYLTATNIKALGFVNPNWTANAAAAMANLASMPGPAGVANFFIRLTQTGTPSSAGSAVIMVDYMGTGTT
jgi:hypothetical protein